jgi:hypothetical protein
LVVIASSQERHDQRDLAERVDLLGEEGLSHGCACAGPAASSAAKPIGIDDRANALRRRYF